jgi:hypothetical protein
MHEIVLVGKAYDRGVIHGRKFAHLIKEAIGEYCHFDETLTEKIELFRQRMLAYLEKSFPELIEELHGISQK